MSERDAAAALAQQRLAARAAQDYGAADALRTQIRELGFEVADTSEGFELTPIAEDEAVDAASSGRVSPDEVASVLAEPASYEVTVQLLIQRGWPEDARRNIAACREALAGRTVQYIVVDCAQTPAEELPAQGAPDADAADADVEIVALEADPGWAVARNAGSRRSRGETVLVLDASIEPAGDLGPLVDALDDPSCGIAGPFGIITDDLRSFRDSTGLGEDRHVDAIEGYLMAFKRERLGDAGAFDRKFKFYRSADIEYSFRVRSLGLAARIVDVPVHRHEHRMWNAFSDEERDRLSKRNFYRFLERWRDRPDLASGAQEHSAGER